MKYTIVSCEYLISSIIPSGPWSTFTALKLKAIFFPWDSNFAVGYIHASDCRGAAGGGVEQTIMSKIMTRNPTYVTADSLAIEALQKMVQGIFS